MFHKFLEKHYKYYCNEFLFYFINFFKAAPAAFASYQVRRRIGAAAGAAATTTAPLDLSLICNLHCNLRAMPDP